MFLPLRHHIALLTTLFFFFTSLASAQMTDKPDVIVDTVQWDRNTIEINRGAKDTHIRMISLNPDSKENPEHLIYVETLRMRSGSEKSRTRFSAHPKKGRVEVNLGKVNINLIGDSGDRTEGYMIFYWGLTQFTNPAWGNLNRLGRSSVGGVGYRQRLRIGRSSFHLFGESAWYGSEFRLDKKYRMTNTDGKTRIEAEPEGKGYDRTMLSYYTIDLPVGLMYMDRHSDFWIAGSVIPRVLLFQRSDTRSIDQRVSTIESRDLKLRPWGLDARLEVGYHSFAFFGRMGISTLIPTEYTEAPTRDFSFGFLLRL